MNQEDTAKVEKVEKTLSRYLQSKKNKYWTMKVQRAMLDLKS